VAATADEAEYKRTFIDPQITQRDLRAATKTTDCLDPQITQIGRFHWERQNPFRKTRFCECVVQIPQIYPEGSPREIGQSAKSVDDSGFPSTHLGNLWFQKINASQRRLPNNSLGRLK
jgi:hypothetical protein